MANKTNFNRPIQRLSAKPVKKLKIQAEARKRLARDLHDGPLQLVSAMLMRLDFCRQLLQADPSLLAQEFQVIDELGQRAVQQMRTMLFELRPLILETQGLVAAVQAYLKRRQAENPGTVLALNINTCNSNGQLSRQEKQVETTIFSIVQEAVNNALKHAEADLISVQIEETPANIIIVIADDGAGFDVPQTMAHYDQHSSLGLLNLQERAELIGAELIIKSQLGQSCQIILKLPKLDKPEPKRNPQSTQRTLSF